MNALNNAASYVISFINESILRPLIGNASPSRKIAVITSVIFSYMAFWSVVCYCRFKAKKKEPSSDQKTPPVEVFKGVYPSKNEHPTPIVTPVVKESEELLSPNQDVHYSKEPSVNTLKKEDVKPLPPSDDDFNGLNDEELSNLNSAEEDDVENDDDDLSTPDSDIDSDDEDIETDDAAGNTRKKVYPQSEIVNGTKVSLRTINCKRKLAMILNTEGKTFGQAIDNGDCFYDSFAQRLSIILGRKVTLQDLRQTISDYIQNLDKGPHEDNWVKQMMQDEYIAQDTYEQYRERVAYDCEESLQRGILPVWGQERQRWGNSVSNI